MDNGVCERFLEGNADLHVCQGFEQPHALDFFGDQTDERDDQLGIAFDDKCRFTPDETTEDFSSTPPQRGNRNDFAYGLHPSLAQCVFWEYNWSRQP